MDGQSGRGTALLGKGVQQMSNGWKITATPAALTLMTGDTGRVRFTITNLGTTPRLADLTIVPDPDTAHPAWFTVDPPAAVLPGRSVEVVVKIDPRVGQLGYGEQYDFRFHGQVGSAVGGEVTVTVAGHARWQVTASPLALEMYHSGYAVVYTVTNLLAEPATAVLEVPHSDTNMMWLRPWEAEFSYHLDRNEQPVQGFSSTAFTLRVDISGSTNLEGHDTVQGRVTTAGGGDPVPCPLVSIHYLPLAIAVPLKPPWWRVTEPGEWGLPKPAE